MPRLVAVGGLSGSGKSTLAARLADALSRRATAGEGPVVLLRSDIVRKQLAGQPTTERLAAEHYTPAAADRVYDELCMRAAIALAHRGSAVLDATFMLRRHRRLVVRTARRAQAPFVGIWIDVDERTRMDRVAARQGDVSDADDRVVRAQGRAARSTGGGKPSEEEAWFVIDGRGDAEATWRAADELMLALTGTGGSVASQNASDGGGVL